jgi:Tfp pilus assembly protein FimT
VRGWRRDFGQAGGKGLTIVEALVVVAILGVMAGAAMPFFSGVIQNSRLDAAARQVVGDVRDARSKATLTGWQYKIVGFNVGGGQTYKNQYRILGRSSAAGAWPADTAGIFESATQMAGPWINVNTLYPGVSLNPSDTTPRFWVSFDARGVAFEIDASFNPLTVAHQTGATRSLRVTSAGSIRIE